MTAFARPDAVSTDQNSALRDIVSALAQPRSRIEASFAAIGAGLSDGADALAPLAATFEAMPAALQGPGLSNALASLAEVGLRADAIAAAFASQQADLSRLVEVVSAAEHPISDLRRAVKMMSIVAINARVVAASVVGDGEDFDVFTHDIAKLSESASATITAFTAVYRRLTDEVGQAARQRSLFQSAHANTLSGLAATMDAALSDAAHERSLALENAVHTARMARQLETRIVMAVSTLDVGDTSAQRIDHVEASLEALCDLLDAGDLSETDAADARAIIGGLEATQLAGAADAFEAHLRATGLGLRALTVDARALADHARMMARPTSDKPPRGAVSSAVHAAGKVLHDCDIERDKLEHVASAVLATVGALLVHVEAVQEIEANMRLVSLNAAVKCAQLGPRGAALNVIARQLRELTGETVLAAQTAMTRLQQAASLAQSFGASANDGANIGVVQLEQDAATALALLQDVDQSLVAAQHGLERDGPAIISQLGAVADAVADLAPVSETLRDLEMWLLEECPPTGEQRPSAAVAGLLRAQRQRYTLDAERQLHQQALGAEPIAPSLRA